MNMKRIIHAWLSWRAKRATVRVRQRVLKAFPQLMELQAQENTARGRHGKVKHLQKARVSLMTQALRSGR